MTRVQRTFACGFALFVAACAGHSETKPTYGPKASECSNLPPPVVNAEVAKRLAAATNIVEYENIWREVHPNAALGTVSRPEITRVLSSHGTEIRDCYEPALNQLPSGRGRVSARFVLDASGKAVHVSITSNEIDDPEVGCCLVKHFSAWDFPAPSAGDFVAVEYPFNVKISH